MSWYCHSPFGLCSCPFVPLHLFTGALCRYPSMGKCTHFHGSNQDRSMQIVTHLSTHSTYDTNHRTTNNRTSSVLKSFYRSLMIFVIFSLVLSSSMLVLQAMDFLDIMLSLHRIHFCGIILTNPLE
jgi:hypothetical protein